MFKNTQKCIKVAKYLCSDAISLFPWKRGVIDLRLGITVSIPQGYRYEKRANNVNFYPMSNDIDFKTNSVG